LGKAVVLKPRLYDQTMQPTPYSCTKRGSMRSRWTSLGSIFSSSPSFVATSRKPPVTSTTSQSGAPLAAMARNLATFIGPSCTTLAPVAFSNGSQ
jgi:hypothetical protein